MNKPLYVIGDIHGELEKLKTMLDFIHGKIKEPSVVCFLGDYVDRGPDSYGVVELLSNLKNTELVEYKFLMGNHEDMLIAYEVDKDMGYWSGQVRKETILSYVNSGNYPMPKKHLNFYLNLDKFYKHKIAGDEIICVHAGIDPALPLSEQNEATFLWERDFVGYRGQFYKPEYYVVHGHTPSGRVIHCPRQLGIDTGAVFGGPLSCAEFMFDGEDVCYEVWQTDKDNNVVEEYTL
jgi:serine/threonine protein phosphatase 1